MATMIREQTVSGEIQQTFEVTREVERDGVWQIHPLRITRCDLVRTNLLAWWYIFAKYIAKRRWHSMGKRELIVEQFVF